MPKLDESALAGAMPADLLGNLLEAHLPSTDPTPYSVFFLYMRLDDDGRLEATQYYHEGNHNDAIGSSPQYNANPKTLGYYVKEMALNAREHGDDFPVHGYGLDEIEFPRRFSYCVYFLDELYWQFETETQSGEEMPIVRYKTRKRRKIFKDHDFAFRRLALIKMDMPKEDGTAGSEIRQAAVFVNRMRNENNQRLARFEDEKFCFDFPIQVKYANSPGFAGLVIDPTGTNLGPPDPPPEV